MTTIRRDVSALVAATSDRPLDISSIPMPPAWMVGAVCGQTDPDLFFPLQGNSPAVAKRLCASCPVRVKCLEWALTNREVFGIYGGLTAHERRALRQCKRCGAPAEQGRGNVFCGDVCREASRAETKRAYDRRQPKAAS